MLLVHRVTSRAILMGALLLILLSPIVPVWTIAWAEEDDEAETIVITPSADTYVTQDAPTENFGTEDELLMDRDGRHEAYLRFDVSGTGGSVTNATLRLWVTDGTSNGPELWLSPNTTWSETEMTWNSRPALDDVVSNVGAVEADDWVEYDVTNAVRHDGSYTFALIPESGDGMDVHSREADEDVPELVIELAPPVVGTMPLETADGVPVLLAAGDIASCSWNRDEATARILDSQPGTIATLGDNVQGQGTMKEFEECYDPTWGRHMDRTMPTPGNHDYYTDDAAPYFEYFGDRAGEPGEGYYSYTLGDWQILVLNSNIDMEADSDQERWLREQLEESSATCTLAYWHHSRFSSGTGHGGDDDVAPLWDALYEHGVEIVLNGHEHIYERFAPQTPDGDDDPDHGIRQFTVSTGGAQLRMIGPPEDNSEVRSNTAHGVLRLELHPDGYTWQFLAIEGDVFSDSGTGECHDAP